MGFEGGSAQGWQRQVGKAGESMLVGTSAKPHGVLNPGLSQVGSSIFTSSACPRGEMLPQALLLPVPQHRQQLWSRRTPTLALSQ